MASRSYLVYPDNIPLSSNPHELYSNFVPASAESSSSGGGDFSDSMDNTAAATSGGSNRSARHRDRNASSGGTQKTHQDTDLRLAFDELRSQADAMRVRIDRLESLSKTERADDTSIPQDLSRPDDTSIPQNVSQATTQLVANAIAQAAKEQYKLGDLLAQKAVSVMGTSSPVVDGKVEAGLDQAFQQEAAREHAPATQDRPEDTAWVPRAVRQLTPLNLTVNIADLETFSWEDITANLGGENWSPSFYIVAQPNPDKAIKNCKAYWLLERSTEPFAPASPGMHGAKLTPFYREDLNEDGEPNEDAFREMPVFVALENDDDYTYMGHYKQFRFSDRLGYDTLEHVPLAVLEYWSEQLADPERPDWVTAALIEHFWPKPRYDGPMPTNEATTTPATAATAPSTSDHPAMERRVKHALREYVEELKEWDRESHRLVAMLTPANLLDSFKKADSEIEAGLRLHWEYLECLRWDDDFYVRMVQYKHYINPDGRERSKKKSRHRVSQTTGPEIIHKSPRVAKPAMSKLESSRDVPAPGHGRVKSAVGEHTTSQLQSRDPGAQPVLEASKPKPAITKLESSQDAAASAPGRVHGKSAVGEHTASQLPPRDLAAQPVLEATKPATTKLESSRSAPVPPPGRVVKSTGQAVENDKPVVTPPLPRETKLPPHLRVIKSADQGVETDKIPPHLRAAKRAESSGPL